MSTAYNQPSNFFLFVEQIMVDTRFYGNLLTWKTRAKPLGDKGYKEIETMKREKMSREPQKEKRRYYIHTRIGCYDMNAHRTKCS